MNKVYVIKLTETLISYEVGVSTNPVERLARLTEQTGHDLVLVRAVEHGDAYAVAAAAQHVLRDHQIPSQPRRFRARRGIVLAAVDAALLATDELTTLHAFDVEQERAGHDDGRTESPRGYDEMSATEVIADLHGPGYIHPDEGTVWNGREFVPRWGL